MVNYCIYNIVELPELPEWDQSTYPYANLCYSVGVGVYVLLVSSKPLEYYSGKIGTNDDSITYITYGLVDGYWTLRTPIAVTGGFYENITLYFWTNYDLLDRDGTVYRSASDPIVKEYALYSYNGVELPKLPERDKTALPYAYVFDWSGGYSSEAKYWCIFTSYPLSLTAEGTYAFSLSRGSQTVILYKFVDGVWTHHKTFEKLKGYTAGNADNPVIWSNTTMSGVAGIRTAPIPVRNLFAIHGDSFLKGVEMGRRLKANG